MALASRVHCQNENVPETGDLGSELIQSFVHLSIRLSSTLTSTMYNKIV